MLGNELLKRTVSLAFVSLQLIADPLGTDRATNIRVRNVAVAGVQIRRRLSGLRVVFAEHRQRGSVINEAVPEVAEVWRLVWECARRGLVTLRSQPDDPAISARYLAAGGPHEHGLGTCLAAENPQLVDNDAAGFLARYRIGIGRHHLQ